MLFNTVAARMAVKNGHSIATTSRSNGQYRWKRHRKQQQPTSCTSAAMRPTAVSPATAAAATSSAPAPTFTVPACTPLPGRLLTGTLSPAHAWHGMAWHGKQRQVGMDWKPAQENRVALQALSQQRQQRWQHQSAHTPVSSDSSQALTPAITSPSTGTASPARAVAEEKVPAVAAAKGYRGKWVSHPPAFEALASQLGSLGGSGTGRRQNARLWDEGGVRVGRWG